MIERYTIKFGLAITQKETEKILHESGDTPVKPPGPHKMKARIEIVGDFTDLKNLGDAPGAEKGLKLLVNHCIQWASGRLV